MIDASMSSEAQILTRIAMSLHGATSTLESGLQNGGIELRHAEYFARLYRALAQADTERRLLSVLINI